MKTISFASKLLLYIDELNTTKNHETLFKVTGYVERPDYEHFSAYTKDKQYGTKYDTIKHENVLEIWKTDLCNNKYNLNRKKQNTKFTVRDLLNHQDLGTYYINFSQSITFNNVGMYKLTLT